MTSPRLWVAPDEAGLGRLAPTAALPGGKGAMALSWLQRVELVFFATAFVCGAVAAAALTRTQVGLRDGAGSAGAGRPILTRRVRCCPGRWRGGGEGGRVLARCSSQPVGRLGLVGGGVASAVNALCRSVRPGHTLAKGTSPQESLNSIRYSPAW